VVDLVDGLGGDDQERKRAADIAEALCAIAAGRPPFPLEDHDEARRAWMAEIEEVQ
jgi:hypothetical protein